MRATLPPRACSDTYAGGRHVHSNFWDGRYQGEDYAYGTEPNDFIRAETHRLAPGRVLCLAEGEGQNAVHLAGVGYQVTVHVDLSDYVPPENAFTGIVSVFAHLPATVRRRVHSLAVRSLRVGGCLLLEAYAPRQIGLGTGEPYRAGGYGADCRSSPIGSDGR